MRQLRVLLWIAFAVVSVRLLWIGLDRRESLQRFERAQRRPDAPDTGYGLKITQFYARSGEIIDGEQGLICYGVRDAVSVWMEPPVEELRPALTKCFFVEPRQDTTYTLLAEDAGGKRVSESFQMRVKAAPPEIRMLASDKEIRRGDAATLCYGVEHARSLRLEPIGISLPPPKNCFRFYPQASTTFTLVAVGDAGGTDRKAFRIAVK